MGWTDGVVLGQGSGWQLLCNYKSGMRFEGCKILSAGALVQEHGSSRSGPAPGEECGEELGCDQQLCPLSVGLCFDIILITENFTSPFFFTIYLYVLILKFIMKTKCLWGGTENSLLILQLLAIGLYWECRRANPPSLSEGREHYIPWFLTWDNFGLTGNSPGVQQNILLLSLSTPIRLILIHLNLIFHCKTLSSEENNGMLG